MAARAAPGRIRAAIFGTQHGHVIGKLKAMHESPDYEVVGACEPDPETRRRREEEGHFRRVRWLTEEELLGDASIQLVVVECRVWEAVPFGRKVIAAGKHLHLEKPPTHEMEPFRGLVEEARRKKLLLQMGYIWRFHQGIHAAMDAARKGWLGQVYMMRGTINTDLTAEARIPLARYKGGMLFELGCHQIDRAVDLWGRPKAVKSWLRHDTKFADNLADNTMAVLEYDQGLAVIVCAGRMAGQSQHRSYELIGTEGSILIQPLEPGVKMRVMLREARGPYQAGWQEVTMPPQPRYVGDFRDLARALKNNEPLRYSYDYELLLQETVLRACGEIRTSGDNI
jgi:predicted dehydrogenase